MLTNRFNEAVAYAVAIHAAQTRKGTSIPYTSHLLGVASIVLEHGGDEDEVIAALLHDAAEDQGGEARLADIGSRFGAHVREMVAECSDSFETRKPKWRERKEKYIRHLSEASLSTLLVAAADKLHNTRAMLRDYRLVGEGMWIRFNAPRDDQRWYLRALVIAFERAGASVPLTSELDRLVAEFDDEIRATEKDAPPIAELMKVTADKGSE
jgi:GTP pyrophosphokinase